VASLRAVVPSRLADLNAQYRAKPIIAKAPDSSRAGRTQVTPGRLRKIARHLDVTGLSVLEFGAGRGALTEGLKEAGAARVLGVDVERYPEWEEAQGVEFLCADLSTESVVPDASFDAVVSFVVFEHVRRPLQSLEAIHRALRPGGHAWLYFNLYRGRKASHRYRDIKFPWPHLLFSDEEAAEFLAAQGKPLRGAHTFAWVNKLTAAEYLQASQGIGFSVDHLERNAIPVEADLDFYLAHEDVLGRYPALDLETDFMLLVLRKQASDRVPTLPYLERQAALDQALGRARR